VVLYDFEWDPQKARQNRRKHGVSFDQAVTVFRAPRAASLYDDEHSKTEDRWVTLGLSAGGGLLVVHHTFDEIDTAHVRIRVFSSRKATPEQIKQYGE
jgi:uncharacterized DUF497 family protein